MNYPIFENVSQMIAVGGLSAWVGFCFRIGWSVYDDMPSLVSLCKRVRRKQRDGGDT